MENLKELKISNKNGITLISLVVTIVVLLILAGVSINMLFGDGGIITKAKEARIMTIISGIKEQMKSEKLENIMQNRDTNLETLLVEGKIQRAVKLEDDNNYYLYYTIKSGAYTQMQELGKGENLRDVFIIDEQYNISYIDINGTEYGNLLSKKILEDDTTIRFFNKSFSEYISKISGVKEEDMKFKWMKNQTSLIITDPNVSSLEDLVFFPNLVNLEIGRFGQPGLTPNITTLAGVENCENLNSLSIYYGQQKDYSTISTLENLEKLKIAGDSKSYSNIINILSSIVNLKELSLVDMNIVDLKDLAKMKNLETLDLTQNSINDLSEISKLSKLTYLSLAYNKVENILPLSENKNLTYLNLLNNENIDSNRMNYNDADLIKLNEIGKILEKDGGQILLDSDKLFLFNNYITLDLSNQNLENIECLSGQINLEKLNLNNNNLTFEDSESLEIIKSMTKLKDLRLNNNKLSDISFINDLSNLTLLDICGNENNINLKDIENVISNINIRVTEEQIKTLKNCNKDLITTLNFSDSSFVTLPDLSEFTKLKSLSLINCLGIENFDSLSNYVSLQKLYLNNCNMHNRMINYSNLTNLTYLDLQNNYLWTEDLQNLIGLKNNKNLTIIFKNNSIIDASSLLSLDSSTKINLMNNINLSNESKTLLYEKFGNNVQF
jgi:internalin A